MITQDNFSIAPLTTFFQFVLKKKCMGSCKENLCFDFRAYRVKGVMRGRGRGRGEEGEGER